MEKKIFLSMGVILLLSNNIYGKSQNLDSITVTANKMEENIKDIPQSITIFTDVEIEQKGIKSIKDLIKYIPNLSSAFLDNEKVNFRGINNSNYTNANPIVIYIDGIPHSNMYGFDKSILNVLRVEVLRGPQGTIYGKDSMGGVINIVTKEPSNTLKGSISAQYGTDNYQETAFDVSSPIIENKLFLGLNGAYSQSDGYGTNHHPDQKKDANEKEKYLFNIKLNYNPSDNLNIKLKASKNSDVRYGIEGGIVPLNANINSYKKEDFKNVSYDEDMNKKAKSDAQALHINYDFKDMKFQALTTHKKSHDFVNADLDYSDNALYKDLYIIFDRESKNISQEFRLSNNSDDLRWVAGIYYEKDKFDINRNGARFPAFMLNNPFGEGVNVQTNAISQNNSNTIASFGQVIIPFLDDYELTLGGRYQRIKKKIDLNYYFLPVGTTTGNPANTLNDEQQWNTFLPKIAISYKLNNDLNSYFSVTKGYLAGGYNTFAGSGTTEQNKFDAQKSTNYELGIRGDLLNNSLYLSAAMFYMDIKDLHINSFDFSTSTSYVSNASKAYSKGLELELGYLVNDNWSIDSSFGIIKAKYDEYIDSIGNNNKDNHIEMTPSHTANIGVTYFNDNGVYGRFDIKNQGRIYFNNGNTQKENRYTTANIKLGYLFDNWNIYTYVNNITDESYLTTHNQMITGNILTFGEGRFVGVGAKYSF